MLREILSTEGRYDPLFNHRVREIDVLYKIDHRWRHGGAVTSKFFEIPESLQEVKKQRKEYTADLLSAWKLR